MESNNLIATCYVIEERIDGYIYPTIFLHEQKTDHGMEKLHRFFTVFEAQKFIRTFFGTSVVIEVSGFKPEIAPRPFLSIVRFLERI